MRDDTNNKEGAMKTFMVLGLAAVLSGANLHAQSSSDPLAADRSPMGKLQSYQSCDLQRLERYLLNSLNHEVEGVVVGSLREVAKIKLAQPSCTSEPIASLVNDLALTGTTPAIRYKAYLTSVVLSAPFSFAAEGEVEYQTDEEFFTALARKLETLALRDER
jgi:hypothetical protein